MLIDDREASKRQLKYVKQPKAKKRKAPDDYNWRANPPKTPQSSCLAGGYKSIKHKWLCQYLETAINTDNRQGVGTQNGIHTTSKSFPIESLEIREVGGNFASKESGIEKITSGNESHPKRKSGSNLPQSKEQIEAETKRARKQAELELKTLREEDAKNKAESSLMHEKLEVATKKARREAEEEVALAAEQERGAIAEKSLQKEINGTSRPTSPKNSKPQGLNQRNSSLGKQPVAKKNPKKRPLSSPGSLKPPGDKVSPQKQAQTTQRKKPPELNAPQSPNKGKSLLNQKRSEVSSQSKENVAENEGKTKDKQNNPNMWQDIGRNEFNEYNNQNNAIDSHPLVQVTFVDGSEREHLGELDLHQLDSFRDLWLTIRSAFSARLPKGDFKLIYRDIDNDLMIHKSEPWDYFKAAARSLVLMSK